MRLPLTDLDVRGFRLFGNLRVERLGRVNLFVGRNNSGKSTLLEAVRLWATRGASMVIADILASHDEIKAPIDESATKPNEDLLLAGYMRLFHGSNGRGERHAEIGPFSMPNEQLFIEFLLTDAEEIRIGQLRLLGIADTATAHAPRLPALRIEFGGRNTYLPLVPHPSRVGLSRYWRSFEEIREVRDNFPTLFVSPHGLSVSTVGGLWDAIALTESEDHVVSALRIIAPDVERISLIGDTAASRTVVVKSRGANRPVPLRGMGDGVNRLLGIALSLVSARDGVLLIDEVENGIHYSAQPKLWELIFREAHRLNVQVFATTHSWDCIEAFQEAAQQDEHEEAALIRLNANEDRVSATIFSEQELSIVTREQIEVR